MQPTIYDYLSPVLNHYVVTPSNQWHIRADRERQLFNEASYALQQINRQLIPIPPSILGQQLYRLFLHAPPPNDDFDTLLHNYKRSLSHIPYDIFEDGCATLYKTFDFRCFPQVKDFMDIISPELEKRLHIKHKLTLLQYRLKDSFDCKQREQKSLWSH